MLTKQESLKLSLITANEHVRKHVEEAHTNNFTLQWVNTCASIFHQNFALNLLSFAGLLGKYSVASISLQLAWLGVHFLFSG